MQRLSYTLLRVSLLLVISFAACSCSNPSGSDCPLSPPDTTEPEEIPVFYTCSVVNTYPHDESAFTQGLVFDGGFLYEGTGIYGVSSLRKVELETGNILQSYTLPSYYFGEGITIFAGRILQLTYRAGLCFVYDKESFAGLDTLHYPGEGWGLTHDGARLIMSDGTSTLRYRDPVTFEPLDSLHVIDDIRPVSMLNELEFIKGEIYANVWQTDLIARISPVTGKVTGWIDLTEILPPPPLPSGAVLNGIAYDPVEDRLFVTGKYWPSLFEIELVPVP
ncbi:MAG: glutaminyl-peptide cyclotransferase [Candidatus Eiseniibacteriota bacterium]|nr:MAG: glutaminyl-peptide cyclotransferase [Candidatus Eisenbacteria bacterium]